MTSLHQFEANLCYVFKSAGPKSEYGKQYSGKNAIRHELRFAPHEYGPRILIHSCKKETSIAAVGC
jgi:hypothetical protein